MFEQKAFNIATKFGPGPKQKQMELIRLCQIADNIILAQQDLIDEILSNFPDMRDDYSEFINKIDGAKK